MSKRITPRKRIYSLQSLAYASLFGLLVCWPQPAVSGQDSADAKRTIAQSYESQIRPFLVRHCFECHGNEKPKGDLRVDRLPPDFAGDADRERWQTVVKRIAAGEMPPKSKSRPPQAEIRALTQWVNNNVQAAETARRSQGRTVLRRLNRIEYENTIRDLLGIDVDLKEMLPIDSSADGFDNVGDALHTSSFLMEKYLESARTALDLAIANRPQPPVIKKRYSLKETHQVKSSTERVYRHDGDTVVCFSSSAWNSVVLSPFYPPDRGRYRFRISASGVQSDGKPVTYRIDAGAMGMAGKNHLVGYFDAPADKAAVVDFIEHVEARSTIRIHPYGLAGAQTVHKIGADEYKGKGLAVQWIEVEGPLHATWPPESHRRIFGDLPQKKAPIYNRSDRIEVTSMNPEADTEKILRDFARRAFRRAVTDADVERYVKLVKTRLAEKHTFEQALRVGLLGVMLSPEFLFLRERPGKLEHSAPARRLTYVLSSTIPAQQLRARAS